MLAAIGQKRASLKNGDQILGAALNFYHRFRLLAFATRAAVGATTAARSTSCAGPAATVTLSF